MQDGEKIRNSVVGIYILIIFVYPSGEARWQSDLCLKFRVEVGLEINFWELSMNRWHLKPRHGEVFEEIIVYGKQKSKT